LAADDSSVYISKSSNNQGAKGSYIIPTPY
jgi:hypothetical protein